MTIVEVGANFGNSTTKWVKQGYTVYAFEPTPDLILHLHKRFRNCDNLFILPLAVDEENGWATFNIAGSETWGCSSLYDFSTDLSETWPTRNDFKFTDKIKVMKTRLDRFIEDNQIKSIDYLWVDAQGNDFRVLKSLGKYIDIVKEGRCEGSYTVNLYKGTMNHVNDISAWLNEHGFKTSLLPDRENKEADVIFSR